MNQPRAAAAPAWHEGRNWRALFATIWAGQAFSVLGSNLVQFGLVWWLTQATGSATVLATATLVGTLPEIFLSPIAGALVDRWNRRLVMIAADTLIACATLGLIVLYARGMTQVWHIYAIMLVRSAGGAFHYPAMQASTSLMVPKAHLPQVAGFNQMLYGAIRTVAPPLGALLLEVLPMAQLLAIDLVTAAIAVTPLLLIPIPQPPARPTAATGGAKPSLAADLLEGCRYVYRWPGLTIIFCLALVICFVFYPAFALMPLLVTDYFGGRALHLGWLQGAWGIGVVIGGLTLGIFGAHKRLAHLFTPMLGLAGQGVGLLILCLAPPAAFLLGLGGMFFAAFMYPLTNGPLQSLLQANVAPEMQGRVFTLMTSLTTGITPISLMIAGPVADALGVRFWFVAAGLACLLFGVAGYFTPALANLEADMQAERIRLEQAAAPEPAVLVPQSGSSEL